MYLTEAYAVQAQPYGISMDDVARVVDICRVYHLGLWIDARDSWWNPGATTSLLIFRRDIDEHLRRRQ